MARASLGSLVVSLGLDAAEFVAGLTKSEFQARKFQQKLEKDLATAAKGVGVALGAMGAAAGAALIAIDQLAKQAGNFKDLEEKTGASAEGLASMAVAAEVAGAGMETVAKASIFLTKNLTGVDDESKAAGAALTALGIPIKEFKALDPAAQMEAVAKALAGFEDGAGKTAVALALFGKAGADLLPFMKELAGESGRQVILTQKQIELADEYADKQARVIAEIRLYAQVAATRVLPAFNALIEVAREFIAELVGIDTNAKKLAQGTELEDFANTAVRAIAFVADSADAVGRIFRITGNVIGATAAQMGALVDGDLAAYNAIQEDASKTIDEIIGKQTIRFRLEKRIADEARNNALNLADTFAGGNKPRGRALDFAGAVSGGKGAKAAAAERQSDAERYLENLDKQLERMQDLSVAEQALLDLMKMKKVTAEEFAAVMNRAAEVDRALAAKKANEEAAKAQEAMNQATDKAIQSALQQASQIEQGNEQLREQIAFLQGGEEAIRRLTDAKLADLIATTEHALAVARSENANQLLIEGIENQILKLRERQMLINDMRLAEKLREEAQALQDVKNMFSDALVDPLTDFVTGTKSAKDAFRDFVNDITRQLARIASQNVANAIFGGNNQGGPDIFGMLAKMLGGMMGGGGGVPGVGFSGGGFGEHFASGGISRGGFATVGEGGPERVFLPAGARVMSNSQSRAAGSNVYNIYQSIPAGADTRAHRQAALDAFGVASNAARRR